MSKSKGAGNMVSLMGIIIISKIIGMLRDVVLANYFGTSKVSDAYLIAVSVPVFLFSFIGQSLTTSYIPMYNQINAARGEKAAKNYTNVLMTFAEVLCVIIFLIMILFPQVVVKIFASGFKGDAARLTEKYIRIMAPSVFLMTAINIFGAYLNIKNNFLVPAAVSLPRNAVIIVSIVIASVFGANWLGYGLLGSYLAELLLLLPFVLVGKYFYKPSFKFKDSDLKETFLVVLPLLIGMFVSQINKIIDRSMASTIVVGGVSALTYASIINNAVQEICVTGILTVLFANCARLVAEKKEKEVHKQLFSTTSVLSFLLIPATVGIIVLARPIVSTILCRGNFNEISLNMTTGALRCYSVGLLFLAVRDTFVKVFCAYKQTKITTVTSVIAIILNIILNFSLYHIIGLNGLAIATSISSMVHCIILIFAYKKYHSDVFEKNDFTTLVKTVVKSLLASALMGIIVWLLYNLVKKSTGELVTLIVSAGVGIIVYAIISFVIKNEALKVLFNRKKVIKNEE